MKKKLALLLTLVFITLFAINVKAESYNYSLEREGDSWSYVDVPRTIKSGDIIKVNSVINTAVNYTKWLMLRGGEIHLEWDKNVFELVPYENTEEPSEPKLYNVNTDNFESIRAISDWGDATEGHIAVEYRTENDYINYGKNKIVEFTFKVKNNIKDGIYTIKQTGGYLKINYDSSDGLCEDVCEIIDTYVNDTLKFQVGDQPIESSYSKNNIPNSTYVIGNHLFTRAGSDAYDGVLTTEYIMLASKSIESNKKEDMIIYAKNARGNWINAITNESIVAPDYFDISYIDMKNNSKNNGIYVYNDIAIEFVELDDTSAAVRIENDNIYVEGIATVSNGVATLTIDGKTYRITMGKESITLQSSDNYLPSCTLNRKYVYTLTDLYENELLYGGQRQYFNSKYNGKFVSGTKEIYTYQTGEGIVKVLIRDTATGEDLHDLYMYYNEDENELNYYDIYRIVYGNNNITVYDQGGSLSGTYAKESGISLEDAVKSLINNIRMYAVHYTSDIGNGFHEKDFVYPSGTATDYSHLLPDLPGYGFSGWYLNNVLFDFDTPITVPISLVGKWENNILTPVLSISATESYSTKTINITNMTGYCAVDVCDGGPDDEYTVDGFELYVKDGDEYNFVDEFYTIDTYEYTFEPNTNGTYVIRTFIEDGYNKVYSPYSNEEVVDTTFPVPTIAFAPEAGNGPFAEPSDVSNNIKITNLDSYGYVAGEGDTWESYKIDGFELSEKIGDEYVFISTIEPGQLFMDVGTFYGIDKHLYVRAYAYRYMDDDEPVYSDYSSELVLEAPIPTPEVSFALGDVGFAQNIIINNEDDYCVGTCDGGQDDEYLVSGYKIYEKVGNNYTLVTTRDNPLSYYGFTVTTNNSSQDKVYVVRMFITRGDTTVYSADSNELVVEAVATPTLAVTEMNNGEPNFPARTNPLHYEGGYEGTVFNHTLRANYELFMTCDPNDPSQCEESVEDIDVFEKNGNTLTLVDELDFGELLVHIPAGSSKTFVAKAYVLDNNSEKIYSGESNTITYNLTNPVYTFETFEASVANKVNVRGYINGYEVSLHGIKVNNVMYEYDGNTDEGEFVTVDSSVLENVDSIILGLEMVSQQDPTSFIVEVTATRGSNSSAQYACYYNSSTHTFAWGDYSEVEGYELDDTLTTENECTPPEEQAACYLNNDNAYVWGKYANTTYTPVPSKDSESSCRTSNACYYNSSAQTYSWGDFSAIEGYTLEEGLTTEQECVPSEQPACYLNESTNTYVWGMYAQHEGYTLEPNIDNGPSCTAANG